MRASTLGARRMLLEIFAAAVRAVDGRAAVRVLASNRLDLPVVVIAIGKAASSMALGAHDVLGQRIAELLVITKDGHVDPDLHRLPMATILESAHPVPDERSLAAGAVLEQKLATASGELVFLISGGASSLVESLVPGRSLADLRALNQRGLAAGWDIATLNAERRKLSRLKGGGVARLLAGRAATALFISDVPGDDPGVIGSGLLGPDSAVPDQIRRVVVGNNSDAVRAAAECAQSLGLTVERREARFEGEADAVAREFVAALRESSSECLVWGGESTVTLPERHGRGGRNTHLALTAAQLLGKSEDLTMLAAGTDGSDGPTADAGGIVDASTRDRLELAGVDLQRALVDFDSNFALEVAGDLVHTGPTGTNVGDILIGLKRRGGVGRDAQSDMF